MRGDRRFGNRYVSTRHGRGADLDQRIADVHLVQPKEREADRSRYPEVGVGHHRIVGREHELLRVEQEAVETLTPVVEVEIELAEVSVGEHLSPRESEGLREVDRLRNAGGGEQNSSGADADDTRVVGRSGGYQREVPVFERHA